MEFFFKVKKRDAAQWTIALQEINMKAVKTQDISEGFALVLLTLCPDRLRDRARVTEAIRVDGSDNKEVNGVGEESHNCVLLLLHMVRNRLPGAAHWLAEEEKGIF